MSQSVLLTIARTSIEEVLQGQNSIERRELLEQYPILREPMATQITLYLGTKIRGMSKTQTVERSLLEDIIYNAKAAAFQDEDFDPLVTSEYLHATIQLTVFSPDGELSHQSEPIVKD
ncbi:MAG: AMMECR1 domain-containing protein [Sulfuricurvum sp.]|uniref:AMMECR1 domain-containing protein n=1 Tax=Sulfuricurvum sp. TaxID=2025608 RepID=UPI00271C0A09|nr:AMMECR1 domain-containing protein [Sulfuricurvum sp.]MDO9056453.1 AMMECR1 domain-containing protein [Sulfuricurvum sp.]MDP3292759.1 AMMECR1 domain-containing protein [Sulfuricurvum sp.]